ncbi:MAG: hypothetical protein ACPHL6_04480, partial [Rubripirellula sp.]
MSEWMAGLKSLKLVVFFWTASLIPALLQGQSLPREDVIEIPAISDDLCVSNLFQSSMVLQRDKPIRIWGWCDAGEEVVVEFGGHRAS